MVSITRDSEVSDVSSLDRVPALSELPQFFRRIAQYHEEFIVYDDGFRGWTFGYVEIGRLAASFAARLRTEGVRKGDAVRHLVGEPPRLDRRAVGLFAGRCGSGSRRAAVFARTISQDRTEGPASFGAGGRSGPGMSAKSVPVWRLAEIEQQQTVAGHSRSRSLRRRCRRDRFHLGHDRLSRKAS